MDMEYVDMVLSVDVGFTIHSGSWPSSMIIGGSGGRTAGRTVCSQTRLLSCTRTDTCDRAVEQVAFVVSASDGDVGVLIFPLQQEWVTGERF
jgi:hypothetical protein